LILYLVTSCHATTKVTCLFEILTLFIKRYFVRSETAV